MITKLLCGQRAGRFNAPSYYRIAIVVVGENL